DVPASISTVVPITTQTCGPVAWLTRRQRGSPSVLSVPTSTSGSVGAGCPHRSRNPAVHGGCASGSTASVGGSRLLSGGAVSSPDGDVPSGALNEHAPS